MKILGIETSHDDTSIAILEDNKVIALETISQVDIFKEFGGTIPEISSREHVKNINLILEILLKKYDLSTIDYIAYTKEPGLVGTLQIGYLFASAVSLAYNKPIIPINHLIGHFYSCALDNEIKYPSLCLLVSGGHTQLMLINSPIDYEIIGQTLDDAVGEAFDKVSSKLQLGFPGGPIIDKIYKNYKGEFIKFTEPNAPGKFNFSFSGLKSQVINYYHNKLQRNEKADVDQIAASFQDCAVNYLINQTKKAVLKYDVKSLVLAGGVSANSELRKRFLEISKMAIIPNLKYATDNGAMIASCAYQILKEK
ncbi:tRNA (adenosine(37)-N6)-threonylcarbamoyltransferase complex transferase subunit TsaD [Mycoplasma bovis]|uniref:tRNA N6-adenosine threonylcarbamoyltransferase n=1 Tax=Mycoplasmopsis bovis (strain ATCC 25523 / DSM 22781 / NCTC 10131 / PG45) TaxID=289397 RepID=A0A454ANV1_MYCBG|nr:tRNA (adenosine(37)-N6)-threonylcarbamoyltransferase complex transferase subunit TsaD [Mycoplasmopsis bovis]ADR24737.1 peptidase, M22 family [Mycoplasmopsis bovis PG45]MBT1316359.1 tRNA (adenosine(37)-N6)-threonylcarbamoyltransferase complex transferase subunit TsaD [Mycoplasmopsis bovis]MBT1326140.1 tRNA (adenosine(37)-N6)-threonylcarbamoyltransferase complex transferase subunit TsaD [Mycoplasmopsis bovis]MBT1367996.1 tRNA (adenosine(37)-N6)-threonylcarbamoyltransferase complex transferase 